MKKKVFAVLLTVALVAAQPVCAFARSSGSSNSTVVTTPSDTPTDKIDGVSLVKNGAGSKTENVNATFAIGGAATAGLSNAVVTAINSINSGAKLSDAVGDTTLEGYSALIKTAAIIVNEVNTNAVANKSAIVSLYVPNLISGLQNVKILYYENATGTWKVLEPVSIDYNTKVISFEMFGSGTVTVIHK